jgi:hypothetical protein
LFHDASEQCGVDKSLWPRHFRIGAKAATVIANVRHFKQDDAWKWRDLAQYGRVYEALIAVAQPAIRPVWGAIVTVIDFTHVQNLIGIDHVISYAVAEFESCESLKYRWHIGYVLHCILLTYALCCLRGIRTKLEPTGHPQLQFLSMAFPHLIAAYQRVVAIDDGLNGVELSPKTEQYTFMCLFTSNPSERLRRMAEFTSIVSL